MGSNWMNNYFFNKVSDFILGLILILLIFWIIIRNLKKEKKLKINKFSKYLYLVLILILIEWFIKSSSFKIWRFLHYFFNYFYSFFILSK